MIQILEVLRQVEMEVADRGHEETHVGTIKFATGGKRRPGTAPRIPSFSKLGQFGGGETLKIDTSPDSIPLEENSDDSDDDDLEAVLSELELGLAKGEEGDKELPYSTTVVRGPSHHANNGPTRSNMSSVMTVKPESPLVEEQPVLEPLAHRQTASAMTIDTFRTAHEGSTLSVAVATIGDNEHAGASDQSMPGAIETSSSFMYHRFTMIKPGSKRHSVGILPVTRPSPKGGIGKRHSIVDGLSWGPFDFFLGRARKQSTSGASTPTPSTKCDLCGKRLGLGYKTILECDDCGIRVHVKCGEFAPNGCGVRIQERANSGKGVTPSGK